LVVHAAVKILIGLIIIAAGFGLFVDSVYDNMWTGLRVSWWHNFLVVVTGVIPALLILAGLFVVWLEADELKAEKEIKEDTKSAEEAVKKAVTAKPRPRRKKK
jgi:chromate transport protein ChrA